MAYVIPVAVLLLDHAAAAAAINEPPDFFDNPRNNRYDGVTRLTQATNAPVNYFADEGEEIYYVGIQIESDWCIEIGPPLVSKVVALKKRYPHPLIQTAKLAVVSQFN